ncbi:aminotransferase class V-fold PLP-dependent enzyme [Hugonella massiliensis]|uniref:aminotransferase class V-fold PLP-dependent enzyme n=1 Tax=Hugonella massiliensis TaxID=1720315 RepID=UPI00073F0B80|nr:SufS family cysteine desulfurase [Hugonella massiliensis]
MAEAPKATREAIEAVDLAENPYKNDFPLLANNPHLTFLDSAATAQRPTVVLDAQRDFYERLNSNPLRGLYKLSVEATEAIDKVRRKVADFIGAPLSQGIVFTRNATESLNLLALSLGRSILGPGDEVCITIMEHHSNILPWQQVCRETGAKLVFMRPNEDCKLTAEEIEAKITRRTKIVSVTQVSNVLGVENPVKDIAKRAHAVGALCFVDGAQSVPHMGVNVQELGCDALAFSAHKMFGPMGIGVLWAKKDLLEKMPPFLTGGEMIDWVTEDSFGCAPVPQKFEAGTQDAAGIAGLGAAVDYMRAVKRENLEARERALVADLARKLGDLPFIRLIGPSNPNDHVAVVSFNVCGIHPHDVASILDSYDVAIRAGHHCAQPLLAWMGIESCCRASVAVYNDEQDIDNLVDGLKKVWEMFNGAE